MGKGNRIIVLEKNILITGERNYYYELVSSPNDISFYKSSKKIEFL